MSYPRTDCRWGVIFYSQEGESHRRRGLRNQDAIDYSVADDGSPPVILAVADGHGSAKSFRSGLGAQFAVEAAVAVCREFLDGMREAEPPAVKNAAGQGLPAEIVRDWQRRVREHVDGQRFTKDELARLTEQAGAAASERATRPEQLYVAYGTTLLVAVLTSEFLVCFQVGDGDILGADDSTDEVCRIIAKDEALIANETSSLCQDDAVRQFRCKFRVIQHSLPGLVLLSTDGYANSFASPDAFLKVGHDYLDMLRTDGADEVVRHLPAWLEETSCNGSGDDITVGIIYRREPPLRKSAVDEQEPPKPQGTSV